MLRVVPTLLLCLVVPWPAAACYWDRDTLAMERKRFPDAARLLAGQVLRQPQALYLDRITECRALIAEGRDELPLRDDLAVALDKTGQHAEAIRVAEESLARAPERYETLANLGTFHAHAGNLEKGAEFIRAALRVNPQAHFGREVVQLRVVEYVLARRAARPGLPLDATYDDAIARLRATPDFEGRALDPDGIWLGEGDLFETRGFAAFAQAGGLDRDAALKGLLGMMMFGQPDHPVLLEALGDVLMWDRRQKQDAKRLAGWAYLRAAEVADPEVRSAYRARAALALVGHRGVTLRDEAVVFAREREKGRRAQARAEARAQRRPQGRAPPTWEDVEEDRRRTRAKKPPHRGARSR